MLKLGIIGINEGNGHPYSYSSIFNGFNEALLDTCPFDVIKKYLKETHQNKHIIEGASITHIWTQDIEVSQRIANLTYIPHVVNEMEDLIGKVDAVIIARDDVENHWAMAKPFIEKGIPVFIDKLFTPNYQELEALLSCRQMAGGKIMASSSSRFTPEIYKAKENFDQHRQAINYIHGISKVSWVRYANHLLDGICYLFGTDFESVQNLGDTEDMDIVHIQFKAGPHCVLTIGKELALPISFTVYTDAEHYTVPFTDASFSSYFFGFYNMLADFVSYVTTGSSAMNFADSIKISSLIIAASQSKKEGNRKMLIDEILPPYINKYCS
jgi:predicted dehydrogenase